MATANSIDFQWKSGGEPPMTKPSSPPLAQTPKELEDVLVVPAQSSEDLGDELTSFLNTFDNSTAKPKTPNEAAKASEVSSVQQPLTLRINDKKTLYAMWISVFKSGGLFIPKEQLSGKTFKPGDSLMFRLSLPDDPAQAVLLGVKMAWETPTYSETRMTAGIGFAFDPSDAAENIKQRAERLLTDVPLSTPNFTI